MIDNQIIKKIVSTWKSQQQRKNSNVYTFYVDPLVNKFQIKEVIEKTFATKVEKISSLREKPMLRSSRRNIRTKLKKKIFVKLKDGYGISGAFSSEKLKIDGNNSSTNDRWSKK